MKSRIPLLILAVGASACSDESTRPSIGLGPNIEIVAGDGQRAEAGSAVPGPLVVRVTDSRGRPVQGRTVRFTVLAGQGSVLEDAVVTNAQGLATQQRWTLGTVTGVSQFLAATVSARAGESNEAFVLFSATVVPGAPAALALLGSGQLAVLPGSELDTLTLVVRDRYGNPVPDVNVGWAVSTGGGSITPVTSRTDALGMARARWVLGSGAGEQTATATSGGLSAIFTAIAGTPFVASAIASGGSHTCAIAAAGLTYCWGLNNSRQLGADGVVSSRNALRVPNVPALVSLALGEEFSCGLTASGVAYCWGSNASGQLGSSGVSTNQTPGPVGGGLAFTVLVAGGSHACGVATDGKAYCWGDNLYGQLGDGTEVSRARPREVAGGIAFVTLAAGGSHTCGVARDGETYCWGSGGAGQLGFVPTSICASDFYYHYYGEPCSLSPVRLPSAVRFTTLAAGSDHTCGIATDEAAYCWGAGIAVPTGVRGGLRFSALTGGSRESCGVASTGAAYCWKLDGATIRASQLVSDRISFASLTQGSSHTCGIARGTASFAYCWSHNAEGQVGDGTTFSRAAPVHVVAPIAP